MRQATDFSPMGLEATSIQLHGGDAWDQRSIFAVAFR